MTVPPPQQPEPSGYPSDPSGYPQGQPAPSDSPGYPPAGYPPPGYPAPPTYQTPPAYQPPPGYQSPPVYSAPPVYSGPPSHQPGPGYGPDYGPGGGPGYGPGGGPAYGPGGGYPPAGYPAWPTAVSDKSKATAGLLQLLLGGLLLVGGVGRLYAGNVGLGVGQIVASVVAWVTVFCGFFLWGVPFVLTFAIWVWFVVDGIMMLAGNPKDGQGRPLRSS